jgi:hypothetical protein
MTSPQELNKSDETGPFWVFWNPRVPSTGWIDSDRSFENNFATREERDEFARRGDHSSHTLGGYCPRCETRVFDPIGVSPLAQNVDGDPHTCAEVVR